MDSKVGHRESPGRSCLDIRQRTKNSSSLSSGDYWIVLDRKPLKVYCDMKADGGISLTKISHLISNGKSTDKFKPLFHIYAVVEI